MKCISSHSIFNNLTFSVTSYQLSLNPAAFCTYLNSNLLYGDDVLHGNHVLCFLQLTMY